MSVMIPIFLDICQKTEQKIGLRTQPGGQDGEKMYTSIAVHVKDVRKLTKLQEKDTDT